MSKIIEFDKNRSIEEQIEEKFGGASELAKKIIELSKTKPKTSSEQAIQDVMEEFEKNLQDIWLDKPKYIIKHTTNRHKRRTLKKRMRLKNGINGYN